MRVSSTARSRACWRVDRVHIVIATGPNQPVPAVRGGAVNRFWSQMAPGFVRLGHEVTVCAREFEGQLSEEVREGVRYLRRGGFDAGRYRFGNYARSLVSSIRTTITLPAADVYITNDAFSPWLMAARGLCSRTLVAVGRAPKGQFRWYPKQLNLAVPTQAIRAAVLTEASQLRERCAVLPYAIDTDVFTPPDSESPERARRLLYVGRIHPEKGLDLLIAAFRQLHATNPNLTLVVVGPAATEAGGGGSAYLKSLQQLGTGLPIDWRGECYEIAALADIYRSCAWFCYPSLADTGETFGVAPLEAMACGCIPVLSGLQCFDDFLEPGANGFVFDHRTVNPAAGLQSALERALVSDRQELAHAARVTAQDFSIERIAASWANELSRINRASLH